MVYDLIVANTFDEHTDTYKFSRIESKREEQCIGLYISGKKNSTAIGNVSELYEKRVYETYINYNLLVIEEEYELDRNSKGMWYKLKNLNMLRRGLDNVQEKTETKNTAEYRTFLKLQLCKGGYVELIGRVIL